MPTLHELAELGQAVWMDFIRRSFVNSGELQKLIDQGLRGVTANPTILEKAIDGSTDYEEDLRRLAKEGRSVEEIYEALVFEDIGRAADLFRPVFEATGGADGFVSLEVDPALAHDTAGTMARARHLSSSLNRPNVMIKVPATTEGYPAIQTLLSEGMNINITLMFSLAQYEAVAEAYLSGLEGLLARGGNPAKVASVASFFVSRVDTEVDKALEKIGNAELQGKIAIANAKITYARFREIFNSDRWKRLQEKGARVQCPLWASTSTKNPRYPDTLYVDGLIGRDTVNTVPQETLQAFLDHGHLAPTLESGLEEARAQIARLAQVGVDLDAITAKLLEDGVASFAKSFDTLMAGIKQKRE